MSKDGSGMFDREDPITMQGILFLMNHFSVAVFDENNNQAFAGLWLIVFPKARDGLAEKQARSE